MPAVNLTVDVECIRSCRSILNKHQILYRLYINDDLLTERTWIWRNNVHINENIWVDITKTSILSIQQLVVGDSEEGKFKLSNFNIINYPFEYKQINDEAISFTLQ